MSIFYLDFENGNDANDGSTWALAWKTFTNGATAARIAPGDTIRIAKSPDPVSTGITGTWTVNNSTLTLASALTKTIDRCEAAWSASANVTRSSVGSPPEGSYAERLAVAAGFTTGLIAYKDITSADFSAYTKVTFWLKSSIEVAAGVLSLLLDDTSACASPLEDITINTILKANQWTPITLTLATPANLTAVVSVGLKAISDPGTVNIDIDNIEACNGFSLHSLVGKNAAGESFYPIRSIVGTTVKLGSTMATCRNAKYYGTTETVTAYYRNCILMTPLTANGEIIKDSGTSGNVITFSGGWNTATTIRDGETWLDFQSGNGYGITQDAARNFTTLDRISVVRAVAGFYDNAYSGTDKTFTNCHFNCNAFYGFYTRETTNLTVTDCWFMANASYGIIFVSAAITVAITNIVCNSNGSQGFSVQTVINSSTLTGITACCNDVGSGVKLESAIYNNTFSNLVCKYNDSYGIEVTQPCTDNVINTATCSNNFSSGIGFLTNAQYMGNFVVNNLTAQSNSNSGVYCLARDMDVHFYSLVTASNGSQGVYAGYGRIYLYNDNIAESPEVYHGGYYGQFCSREKADQTVGKRFLYLLRGTITNDTTIFDVTPSTRITPNSYSTIHKKMFLSQDGATWMRAFVDGGSPVTISVKVRTSVAGDGAAYNGAAPRLRMRGLGVSEQIDTYAVAAGNWETLTVSGTPAEAGALEWTVDCNGTTGWINVDTATVT